MVQTKYKLSALSEPKLKLELMEPEKEIKFPFDPDFLTAIESKLSELTPENEMTTLVLELGPNRPFSIIYSPNADKEKFLRWYNEITF